MKTSDIKINGEITIPVNITHKQFLHEFILFIESKGWSFNGITKPLKSIKSKNKK